jgi:hypothetical protein
MAEAEREEIKDETHGLEDDEQDRNIVMTRKNLVIQTQISWLTDSKIIVLSLVQLTKISFYTSHTLCLVYV